MTEPFIAAVVQRPPMLLDRTTTLKHAIEHLHEATDGGARLVVFPETYLPGYPVWMWQLKPGADYDRTSEIHAELIDNNIDLDVAGHYGRPDLFQLTIDRSPQEPVRYQG